ncbi:transposase [Nocardia sp. NPDC002869]|uniref:transposase n=1 Tax=Nocardia sp. NPDC002869 TaxID=3161032 RepID=UPI00398D2B7B
MHDAGCVGVGGDLSVRADALFELCDAVLCAEGPVPTLVGLSLTAEHRRGHGGLYDGLSVGRIDAARLRRTVAGLPVPRDSEGRIVLAVDVSPWLRPEKLIKFNTLLANLVIFHNTLDITDVVHSLVAEGWTITADQLAALSPYLRAHISRFGAYATDELTRQPDPFDPALTEVDFTTFDLAA